MPYDKYRSYAERSAGTGDVSDAMYKSFNQPCDTFYNLKGI
jgi:hypothetical protein